MLAVEFETQAKNGMIKIPEKYREIAEGELKIIILKQDQESKISSEQRNSSIRKSLKRIQGKNIFQDISDPAAWQKTVRNQTT